MHKLVKKIHRLEKRVAALEGANGDLKKQMKAANLVHRVAALEACVPPLKGKK